MVLLKTLSTPFQAVIIPRLLLALLRFSQPALIVASIRYVTTQRPDGDDALRGYVIVLSAVAAYGGLAVGVPSYRDAHTPIAPAG